MHSIKQTPVDALYKANKNKLTSCMNEQSEIVIPKAYKHLRNESCIKNHSWSPWPHNEQSVWKENSRIHDVICRSLNMHFTTCRGRTYNNCTCPMRRSLLYMPKKSLHIWWKLHYIGTSWSLLKLHMFKLTNSLQMPSSMHMPKIFTGYDKLKEHFTCPSHSFLCKCSGCSIYCTCSSTDWSIHCTCSVPSSLPSWQSLVPSNTKTIKVQRVFLQLNSGRRHTSKTAKTATRNNAKKQHKDHITISKCRQECSLLLW